MSKLFGSNQKCAPCSLGYVNRFEIVLYENLFVVCVLCLETCSNMSLEIAFAKWSERPNKLILNCLPICEHQDWDENASRHNLHMDKPSIDLSGFLADLTANAENVTHEQGAAYYYAMLDIPLTDALGKESYYDPIVIVRSLVMQESVTRQLLGLRQPEPPQSLRGAD